MYVPWFAMWSICYFLYILRAVPLVSLQLSVNFLFIYIVTSLKEKRKISFCLFLSISQLSSSFSLCMTTVYFFLKRKRPTGKQYSLLLNEVFLSVRQTHTFTLWNFTTFYAIEKEKTRAKDLKSSRQQKKMRE